MIDDYELKARKFPAIINILPVFLFSHFYLYEIIPGLIDSIILTKIIGDFSMIFIFLFFIEQLSRYVSKKFLQNNFFKNEFHFPTTNYLLYSDSTYTIDKKEKIRDKIKEDFEIVLLDRKSEKENENEARKIIKESIDLIRSKVKNGRLLLQHNIEYGFIRNLIGGMVISIPFSLFNAVFFFVKDDQMVFLISSLLFFIYSVIFFSRRKLLVYYANNYALILFNEYLSLK